MAALQRAEGRGEKAGGGRRAPRVDVRGQLESGFDHHGTESLGRADVLDVAKSVSIRQPWRRPNGQNSASIWSSGEGGEDAPG